MYLTQKQFNFCDKVGVMVQNQTPEHAHQKLVEAICNEKGADPYFVEQVKNQKCNANNVAYAVIYRYSIDLEYVVNGLIKDGHIADYGNNGTPSGLDVTNFYKDGNYKSYESIDSLKLWLYNDANLFSLEELKGALKKVIDKRLPSNYTSFKSTNWNVIAYLVPIYTIFAKGSNGKEYQLHYNLHNMKYTWEWPWDPALKKKGKVASLIQFGLDAGGIVLSGLPTLIGLVNGATVSQAQQSNFIPPVIAGGLGLAAAIIATVKTKKDKVDCENYFHENPTDSPFKAVTKSLIPAILGGALGIIALILLAVAAAK